MQLLLAATVAGDGSTTKSVSQSIGRSAPAVSVCSAGICGDAGAFSSVDERTGEGGSVGGDESGKAAIRATGAEEAEWAATEFVGGRRGRACLAEALLRFQRVERAEASGEVAVHAPEPGEAGVG